MNVNDMIDTILNFDLDVVLAGLNESSHHLSQMEFISLIVITVGAVLLCLTGLKLVRFWSVLAGLSAGCAAGIAVGAIAGLDQTIALAKEKAEDVCATFSASSIFWICSASERNRFKVSC